MKIQNLLLRTAYQLKPLLQKVVPVGLLRKVKAGMINKNYQSLKKFNKGKFIRNRFPDGVNLIGAVKAETGLGQSCRILAYILKNSKISWTLYNYAQIGNMRQTDSSMDEFITNDCRYNINLIHINPRELGIAYAQLPDTIWKNRYNIGFWLWELEEFPDEWVDAFTLLDEVWTPSEFISKAVRKKTDKPVYTVPYCIEVCTDEKWTRKEFLLPEDKFLFLIMYDANSISERKNPKAAIRAYKEAFHKNETGVGLVIKASSLTKEEKSKLENELRGISNFYFITETMEKSKVNSLIQCVDCVVSLHRAEGFGLVLAEAMYLGIPAIATNWSSNTEFMNAETACMVDYKLVKLDKDYGLFKKGQRWADADVHQAAEYMKRLYTDRDYYEKLSEQASRYIKEKLSMKSTSELIQMRLKHIYEDAAEKEVVL